MQGYTATPSILRNEETEPQKVQAVKGQETSIFTHNIKNTKYTSNIMSHIFTYIHVQHSGILPFSFI